MRISSNKLTLALLLCIGFGACMDHSGQVTLANRQPTPVGDPDQKIIDPLLGGASGGGNTNGGSNTGGGNTGGGSNTGGGGTGSGGTGGGPAGGPVPEPGTMLLVGTGLAGAAMLRRKRKAAH